MQPLSQGPNRSILASAVLSGYILTDLGNRTNDTGDFNVLETQSHGARTSEGNQPSSGVNRS